MRHIYILCLTFFSLSSFGSHILGGDITWKCLGNGQYEFHLTLFRDCQMGSAFFPSNEIIKGPQGNIPVTKVSQSDISPSCSGGVSLYCGMNGYGAVEMVNYKSAPITLTGTPSPAGWEFKWDGCCRSSGFVNINNSSSTSFGVVAKMYAQPGGCYSSPYFDFNPALGLTTYSKVLSAFTKSPNGEDSLYIDFGIPLSAGTPISFSTGYSASQPFPNTNSNSLNGPISIDHSNGLISVDIQSGVAGTYAYSIHVEQWRNNVLVAELQRDASAIFATSSFTNNSPIVNIDTSNYKVLNRAGNTYSADVYPGDTLQFEMVAVDQDFSGGTSNFQIITFDGAGRALDTMWGGTANYTSKPVLSPVGQTGFATSLQNRVNFAWVIGQEHFQGENRPHIFRFSFSDDHCPYNGINIIMVEVNVKTMAGITQDSLFLCEGDSVQLNGSTESGNYLWTPSNGLSSTSVAAPQASPASSQYYYLEDPQNPGFKDSVYVEVTPAGSFSFSFNNGQLEIADSAQTTNRTWYYNGIPFSYTYDTLTPFGLGDYYVVGKNEACKYTSDTVTITSGMSFSVSSTGNGGFSGTMLPITGSMGITCRVNQNVNVSSVSIPGISDLYGKTGGYDLKLQVFDNTQTEMFKKDITLQRPIVDVIKIEGQFSLSANTNYTIVVSGDTGYAFSLYENVQLPATPHNAGLTVTSVTEGAHGQFPTATSTYLLPISMGIDKMVDIDETTLPKWQIYPNPAEEAVTLTGLKDAKAIEIVDVNGKMVRSYSPERDQENFRIEKGELPSGLYFVKVHFDEATSVKKVLFK